MTRKMSDTPTDFNDLAERRGLDAVADQVAAEFAQAESAGGSGRAPEWPEPITPGAVRVADLGVGLLPAPWLRDMVQAVADSTQTPPAMAVLAALAVLATALQRRFEVSPYGDDYTEPLSLWCLVASPSGTRKSAVLTAMDRPFVRWEKLQRDRMRGEVARAEAARDVSAKRIERLKLDAAKAQDAEAREAIKAEIGAEQDAVPDEVRPPRLFTGDTTPERLQALICEHGERMAVHSDEAGIFGIMAGIYTGGAANLDVFLQGYSGTSMRVDRAGRLAHIDRPALSFLLLIQPDVMAEVANSRRFRSSGLLARFLYAVPESNVGRRDVRRHVGIPPEVAGEYERRLFELLDGYGAKVEAPRVIPLSDNARECWLMLAEEIEREQGAGGKFESITDWTSKLPGAVARIAALFELADSGLDVPEVSFEAMDSAVALARRLISHARAAFGLLGTDPVDVDADAVLRWVRAGQLQEFTRRDAQKAQEGRFRSVDRLQRALARLIQCDVLRETKRHNKGAPASVVYVVNPKALST